MAPSKAKRILTYRTLADTEIWQEKLNNLQIYEKEVYDASKTKLNSYYAYYPWKKLWNMNTLKKFNKFFYLAVNHLKADKM